VLLKVALLYDEHRHHFVINNKANTNCQLVEGTSLRLTMGTSANEYRVQVNFTGGLFGVFTQTVVFDFGSRPVLARKLKVELGHITDLDAVAGLCKKLQFDRSYTNTLFQWMLTPELLLFCCTLHVAAMRTWHIGPCNQTLYLSIFIRSHVQALTSVNTWPLYQHCIVYTIRNLLFNFIFFL